MKRTQGSSFKQNQKDSSLSIYLKEINKYKLLTAEEEFALGLRILNGDKCAIDQLVKANLRFVVKVARRFDHTDLPLIDLINEGNLGLMEAAKRFDVNFGCKFITYAVWYIKQSLQRAIKLDATVKIPNNKVETIVQISKTVRHLEQQLYRRPTPEEISTSTKIDLSRIKECLTYHKVVLSIDETGPVSEIKDTLADPDADLNGMLENKSITAILLHLLYTLPQRQSKIVAYYYGIGYNEPKNLDEIAIIMDLSKERVRQLKDIALRELKRRGFSFLPKFGIYPS
jgi:RNA polymerase primary sigma factor